jgi:ATP-binding cassette, subfamily B, bacterial
MSSRSYLVTKFRKIVGQFPYIVQALRLVWYAAPRHTAIWAALLVFQGLLPVATVYLTRTLVNGLVTAVRSPASGPISSHTLLVVAAMGTLILIGEWLVYRPVGCEPHKPSWSKTTSATSFNGNR